MYRLFIVVLCVFLMLGTTNTAGASELSDSSLIHDLQNGGYILYIRHGDATVGED